MSTYEGAALARHRHEQPWQVPTGLRDCFKSDCDPDSAMCRWLRACGAACR